MAVERRLFTAVFILFLLVVVSTAVPISRSLRTAQNQGYVGNFRSKDVKETDKDEWISRLEGRMDIEIADYPGTGANNNHDPKPPGKV